MSLPTLHFLLPFALPPAAAAPIALAGLALPALDALLRAAAPVAAAPGEDFQRTLPHERWLVQAFGIGAPDARPEARPEAGLDEAPLAPFMLLGDGGQPGQELWACVQPVHVQIAHDHLVLIDPAMLALSDAEADALLAVARPLIVELGLTIEAPTPLRWYVCGAALGELSAASPLRATGRSIEIWLPHDARTGERSRAWMKLQNEIQMAWYEHPVNEAREARGLRAANSIWLHAQGRLPAASAAGTEPGNLSPPLMHTVAHFETVLADAAATRGLGLASGAAVQPLPRSFAAWQTANARAAGATPAATLIEIDTLSAPLIQQDWASWQDAMLALDTDWLAPALAALRGSNGGTASIGRITLTLCGETGWTTLTATRRDFAKFWRRGSLRGLLVE